MSTQKQHRLQEGHDRLTALFPDNPYLERLVAKAESLDVTFACSPVPEQWLYHPEHRTIYVWEPDLTKQSLTYLVVVLAHELGHVVDFDRDRRHFRMTRDIHWSEAPDEVEMAAFVRGYRILKDLWIPISLDHYEMMIQEPMAAEVRKALESKHLCCLLSKGSTAVEGSAQAS